MILDVTTAEFKANPYPIYTRVRQETPIIPIKGASSFIPNVPNIFFSRYDDVVSILKDKRFTVDSRKANPGRDLSKAWWIPAIFRSFLNSMVMVDEPDHTRLRTLVHQAFTPRRIQNMNTRIAEISHMLLEQASKKDRIDLMEDFALPLPLTVISEMLGVPEESRADFHRMIKNLFEPAAGIKFIGQSRQFLNAYGLNNLFKKLITLRQRDPQDDVITALVQAEEAGDNLSETELQAMLFLLLFAGHETTVNLIGNGTLALLEHPDQFEKLKANPDLLDSAIEEMLRFTNPVQQIAPRYALEDVEIGGTQITKGSTVTIGIASANRDESVFENAERFDIARDPNKHIAFGFGIHYCLGAPLARMEGQIAFKTLLEYFPNLTLDVSPHELTWRGLPALRGLNHLPVHLYG